MPWCPSDPSLGTGVFLTNVFDQVGTFVMMALGLNIVVGFAGLRTQATLRFFAIGGMSPVY
ncbi:MAG: hypothetical protein R3C44_20955 [Chloroflexota bacterium]